MLWHPSMNLSGCLRLYSITCVALYMQHHSQSIIMMLLINRDDAIQWRYGYFSYLLIWCIGLRKVNSFGWCCDSAICPYRCAKKIVHRIGSHIVHKWDWYDLSAPIVQYVRVCHQMGSRVVQLYGMNPHGYGDPCSTSWTIHPVYFQFHFHIRWSCMIFFPKFHVCKHILSTYCKWFLVESLFDIFIFKFNEFNMDIHLCFNSIVLI